MRKDKLILAHAFRGFSSTLAGPSLGPKENKIGWSWEDVVEAAHHTVNRKTSGEWKLIFKNITALNYGPSSQAAVLPYTAFNV